ncbi:bilin-binding protein-like [Eurosta solidaginis]|uniref:bilin-binding protein-like n=1 Tax=Eurosta solidaginis TaxID=178769 RepID=UPI0035316637
MLKHQFALPPLSILILLASSCLVAGVRRQGACPYMSGLSNVESEWVNYQGRWFMQVRYPFRNDEAFRCQKSDYITGTNDEHIIETFEISNADDAIHQSTGTFTFVGDGQLQIQYPNTPPFIFKILSVDYERYLITYSCQNLSSCQYDEYVWIHTRERVLTQDVVTAYTRAINDIGLSILDLRRTSHLNCQGYLVPTVQNYTQRKC